MQSIRTVLVLVAFRLLAPAGADAQTIQTKDIMLQGQLTPGFGEGVNSSAGITNWVNPNPADNSALQASWRRGSMWAVNCACSL
jgi:hypothetical protein